MERITLPGSRAAEYARAHPGVSIGSAGGHWYAWKQDGDRYSGELTHGDTEDELLAKLDASSPGRRR